VTPRRGPVPDLTKYEQADAADDYRHRMTMNALAFLVTILLIVTLLIFAGYRRLDRQAST